MICGKGDISKAEYFMKQHRTCYNNDLFSFVNQYGISVIVCFTKATFWNLPAAADEDRDSYGEMDLAEIGGRANKINVYEYAPGVKHEYCDVVLEAPLKIYGIRHPSARGGYDAKSVFEALSGEESLKGICDISR